MSPKEASVPSAEPQAKSLDRNRPRSTSGLFARRDQATKATSRTRPTSMDVGATPDPMPCRPASIIPNVRAARPRLDSAIPVGSTRTAREPGAGGISRDSAIAATASGGTLIRNAEPHQ
jgi:hypothetical protein